MVRSPLIFSFPDPAASVCFDLKVMVGYLATSKKLGLRRSLSLLSTRVFTVAASMETSIVVLLGSAGSQVTVPAVFSNNPRTVEIPRWRIENCEAVWLGSISQVLLSANNGRDRITA